VPDFAIIYASFAQFAVFCVSWLFALSEYYWRLHYLLLQTRMLRTRFGGILSASALSAVWLLKSCTLSVDRQFRRYHAGLLSRLRSTCFEFSEYYAALRWNVIFAFFSTQTFGNGLRGILLAIAFCGPPCLRSSTGPIAECYWEWH